MTKPYDDKPDAVEHRFRRYALLQAAATLLAATIPHVPNELSDAVNDAERLLAEIERREK